jgi:hypothetical protein
VFEPVSVRGSGNEGKQAGKIGSDFQRTECTKFSHKRVGSQGALEQSDGQELDQELNLDPKRIAARQPSELKMGFPSFEQHFDLPSTTVGF